MPSSVLDHARRAKHVWSSSLRASRLREGGTPHEVVRRIGSARLRYYPPADERGATPLFVVMPIINRFRILDLEPETSFVANLTRRGIPIYLVDWGEPRRLDAELDFEDYVLRLLPRFLRSIPADQRSGGVDLLGYCLGGTLSVLFAATHPQLIRRLVTLNAPVDFSCDDAHMDLFKLWVSEEYFPVERLTRAFGNYPGQLIQQGFLWQRPLASVLKLGKTWPRFDDPDFSDLFWVIESWSQDGVDLPGAAYRRLIRQLYRDNRIARGTFRLNGAPVDLQRIRCPVKVVASRKDTTCPPAAALALLERVGSAEKDALELPGGHITAVVSRSARKRLHDPLADWLLA